VYPTAEVRWFRTGSITLSVADWFGRRAPPPQPESARVDRYLQPSGGDGLNVKLRAGRMEIKRRVSTAGQIRFTQQAAGLVERWRKWSFDIGDTPGLARYAARTTPDWVAVRKARLLKTYSFRAGELIFGGAAADGCEMELTHVEARGRTWWTLALEAFGEEATLVDNLVTVAKHVFEAPCPIRLRERDSRGYAGWLTETLRKEGAR